MFDLIPVAPAPQQTSAPVALCSFCNRALPLKSGAGRGRNRDAHANCSIIRSRMAEIYGILGRMVFADAAHVANVRGEIFAVTNRALRANVIQINPNSTVDHGFPRVDRDEEKVMPKKGERGICPICGCRVCAKATGAGTGSGRIKEVHRECGVLRSRLNELQRLLLVTEWGLPNPIFPHDPGPAKMQRSAMFAMMNQTLRADVVKIDPDNERD